MTMRAIWTRVRWLIALAVIGFSRFGEAFARYAARVPAFIPRLRWRSASAAPADLRA